MKTKPVSPREVRSGQEVVVLEGRMADTVPVIATSTSEPGITVPRTVNGGGAEMGVGDRVYDVGVRDLREHISDFEEVLNEIDAALGDGSRNTELKAAISEFTASKFMANRYDGALNLVHVEILEDNPGWRNKDQDRTGGMVEINTDTMMLEVEFSLGWASTGLKGMTQNGKPSKGASKGKQTIRPKVTSEKHRSGKIINETVGFSEGSWKRRVRQSPLTIVDSPLSVGDRTKRKSEVSNTDLLHINWHEKKTKVTGMCNFVETAEVARQPRRDQ